MLFDLAIESSGNFSWIIILPGIFCYKEQCRPLDSLLSPLHVSSEHSQEKNSKRVRPLALLSTCRPTSPTPGALQPDTYLLSSLMVFHLPCLWVEWDDPVLLAIPFTPQPGLPGANITWVFTQHCRCCYCFNIPVIDLTADRILMKLDNLVEWDCLIQFLTEMFKNHFTATNSPPLCGLDDRAKAANQWASLPMISSLSFSGLCPSGPLIIWKNKALTLQRTSAPQGFSSRSTAAVMLAYLQPLGLRVALHICKTTSYDRRSCDGNFLLLKSSHTSI